jgi:hypothetical protein
MAYAYFCHSVASFDLLQDEGLQNIVEGGIADTATDVSRIPKEVSNTNVIACPRYPQIWGTIFGDVCTTPADIAVLSRVNKTWKNSIPRWIWKRMYYERFDELVAQSAAPGKIWKRLFLFLKSLLIGKSC